MEIVTGGAGFIGSNYVRWTLDSTADDVVIIDKLTYAGNLCTIRDLLPDPRVRFIEGDIADRELVQEVFEAHRPSAVVNFAAESHVDRSIDSPRNFMHSNVWGAFELLEGALRYWRELSSEEAETFRFLQVSTDEVFGTLGPEGVFSEQTPYAPRSPYAATKASADHLVRAYHETYGLPALITNCSNNFGPYQYPEKLIPLVTLNALAGRKLPVYGKGENVRDWLHVKDHCEAISLVLARGDPGQTYNVGARNERTNIELVLAICHALEGVSPAAGNPRLREVGVADYASLITFVKDRPGHDLRYAIDPTLIEEQLGWRPRGGFAGLLEDTVRWYVNNQDWCREVQAGAYQRERLGLSRASPGTAEEETR